MNERRKKGTKIKKKYIYILYIVYYDLIGTTSCQAVSKQSLKIDVGTVEANDNGTEKRSILIPKTGRVELSPEQRIRRS